MILIGLSNRVSGPVSAGAARATVSAILLLAFVPGAASACMLAATLSDDLWIYDRIFVGEVTGIHLESYEAAKLHCDDPSAFDCFASDSTPRFKIDVVMWRPITGNVARLETVTLGGCAVALPGPLQFGAFFVDDDGSSFAEYWDPSDRGDIARKTEELKQRLLQ